MMILKRLDELNIATVRVLIDSVPKESIACTRLTTKFAPHGEASKYRLEYWDRKGDAVLELPAQDAWDELYQLTEKHWRLTQELGLARWYKMTVMVECNGKYSVDLEYKDDYKEGDLFKED